jgi:hypothetical protein
MGVLDRGAMKLWMAMAFAGAAGATAYIAALRLGTSSPVSSLSGFAAAWLSFALLCVVDERLSRRR